MAANGSSAASASHEAAVRAFYSALAAGDGASPAIVMAIGTAAVWMALRGRRRIALSGPLDVEERRELERLAGRSRQVRELTETLARSGQAPVRYDLERFRALARVESLLDSRT